MSSVVSLGDRLRASRAVAVAADALKLTYEMCDREKVRALSWAPLVDEKTARRIDFDQEFPEGVSPLTGFKFNIVLSAASFFPNEQGLNGITLLPTYVGLRPAEPLPLEISISLRDRLIASPPPSRRPIVNAVCLVPFPAADAIESEQFNPQFFITVEIPPSYFQDPTDMFTGIVRYGGKNIGAVFLNEGGSHLLFAAAANGEIKLFSAAMLANLSAAEQAATAPDAGNLEICIVRLTKRPLIYYGQFFDFGAPAIQTSNLILSEPPSAPSIDLGSTRSTGGYGDYRSDDFGGNCKGGDFGGNYRGGDFGGGYKGNSSPVPYLRPVPAPPKPAPVVRAPNEVGQVKVTEGVSGGETSERSMNGYHVDTAFDVQRLRITVLGIRPGAVIEEVEAKVDNLGK